MLVLEFKVTVNGLAVDPLDHPLKLYPELGVAVTLTCVPLENVPPPVNDPPSPAEAVKVYLGIIVTGVELSIVSGLSLAQVKTNSNERYKCKFFTN